MKPFMDQDFLLTTSTARRLYHEYAEPMPIVDYHCHLSPREICEDRVFDNMAQVWLGGDHYKWRLMRWAGVEERFITGDAPDREKFQKWAETLPLAVGNPLYHWSHLELRRYFGYDGILNGDTAETVWKLCNKKLQSGLSARAVMERSNVKLICTTDDPADSLEWHQRMQKDQTLKTRVFPTWRPEKAMAIGKPGYGEYLETLGRLCGLRITSFQNLILALKLRMDFFAEQGCTISDHSLDHVMYVPADSRKIEEIFERGLAGEELDDPDRKRFETAFMLAMGKEYQRRNWTMQLHFGVRRNNNGKIYSALGADAGVDCIQTGAPSGQTAEFLNALNENGGLPRTILYSLNPSDNGAIGTIIGCFQDSSVPGKLQQGSAWWFNDHKTGMTDQLTSLAELGLLGTFVGMLTDSRSFLSYIRHEYFRRILCDLVGGWVEEGQYPSDEPALGEIIKGISYNNAVRYFGFPLETR